MRKKSRKEGREEGEIRRAANTEGNEKGRTG
jgi:hypothetical protein